MYMTLLQEAITELQGQKVENMSDCTVATTLDGYLPQSYVEEETERIIVYSRIAKVSQEEERVKLLEYLAGRYGSVPSEVDNLIWIAMLKNLASKLGVTKVIVRAATCQLLFSLESDNQALLDLVEQYDMMSLDMSAQPKVVVDLDMGVKEKIIALVRLLSIAIE